MRGKGGGEAQRWCCLRRDTRGKRGYDGGGGAGMAETGRGDGGSGARPLSVSPRDGGRGRKGE